MISEDKNTSRKNYRRPQLVTYGAIHQITQALGIYMRLDGGIANMMKRSQATPP
ncbi:MAG: hypothetical protein ONB48_15745 [candidate division KSB1 bacterium]|nr:hypothetical protein [candidate division KSB1 bacterium]MDZ7276120.1 hypothetical protein [candidate division KSB1 bacterium]MDZ7287100.1 hypothetical protein [candidate division KSB1 bacterium]MDZ7296975.1 hypothetical protein [candidate division KSB1 bacterium]MDZ7306196.1 hypothetical protein [candidate division KSB1 bacterium]